MKEINGKMELDTLTKNNNVVLVDFFANWCGPCRMLTPTLEKLAQNYRGSVVVAKIDIDKNNDLASGFKVMAVPTLVLFKDNAVVEQFSGMRSLADLSEMIEKYI